MPTVSGRGGSLGAAFRDAVRQVSLGAARESYDRVTAVGQFRQLFGSKKGYAALGGAGLDVRQARTFRGWLDGTSQPNKANTTAIHKAYRAMAAGGVPGWAVDAKMSISGQVGAGRDVRDRGSGGNAPLRIDLGQGDFRGVAEAAMDDGYDDDDLDDLIGEELVEADIGDTSGGWSFPGGAYTVSISY